MIFYYRKNTLNERSVILKQGTTDHHITISEAKELRESLNSAILSYENSEEVK